GSGTTGLTNSAGDTVAFLVDNPNAKYVMTPKGALPTVGRNTEHLRPINDIDVTAAKRFNFTERVALEFSARAFNVFNHPQYTGGYLNDVTPNGATSGNQQLPDSEQADFRGSDAGILEQSEKSGAG